MEIKVYNSYMYGLLQAVENLKQCLDSIKAAEDEGKRFIDLSYASCYPDRYARINVCFRMEAERLEDFVNRAYNKISSLLDQPLTKEEQEFIFNSYLTDDFCEIKPIWLSTCYMPGGYPHSSILLQCRSDERFYLTRIIGYKKPDEEKYCTFWTNTKKHWYPTEAYRATERCLYYDKYKADEIRKTALHHSDLLYKGLCQEFCVNSNKFSCSVSAVYAAMIIELAAFSDDDSSNICMISAETNAKPRCMRSA